jgi:hypothetical protein
MNRTTFEVGTFEVNCSILSENGKAIVVMRRAYAQS